MDASPSKITTPRLLVLGKSVRELLARYGAVGKNAPNWVFNEPSNKRTFNILMFGNMLHAIK